MSAPEKNIPAEPGRSAIEAVIGTDAVDRRHLVPVMQRIQQEFRYVPPAALGLLAEKSGTTLAHIKGLATFYHSFRLVPAGEHFINVCVGTACHLKGAQQVYDAFKKHLAIPEDNDTDEARQFTVATVACLGCCNLAPVVQIGDKIYGNVKQSAVDEVIADFLAGGSADREEAPADHAGTADTNSIRTCLCSGCQASGSAELFSMAKAYRARWNMGFEVAQSRCRGQAHLAPLVEVHAGGKDIRYVNVTPDDLRQILRRQFPPANAAGKLLTGGRALLERIGQPGMNREPVHAAPETAGSGEDIRMATAGDFRTDPVHLEEYRVSGGFAVLDKILKDNDREKIITAIRESGLRGRGGAGFLSGIKWHAVFAQPGDEKYLVCNGDEGDPGAFMDRMLLETYPLQVIEGMILAAFAVGARQGYCYVRAEYPFAVRQMNLALDACRERGLLGSSVMDTGFSFDIEVITGAGAFVCGEETALLRALEGERGTPSLRPPYPAEKGLDGKPTLINNVETYALVPGILRKDEPLFDSVGTDTSRGTKVFALAGKIKRGGLIEVPMGTTIHHIVEEIGGGTPDGTPWKGVQLGGPSGGCIPYSQGETPVDFFRLQDLGTMMGSGGIVVMDRTDCMVDIARYFLEFTRNESCGKCTFCRLGTTRMLGLLEDLCEGRGTDTTIRELEGLAAQIHSGSICGLGRTSPNPVLSTLRWFRDEYEAHVRGECPAGVCKKLIRMEINDKCIGCTRCAQNCPVEAIGFTPLEKHIIDPFTCIRCGICQEVCPEDAIERIPDTLREKPRS